jgi:hypothetical protein
VISFSGKASIAAIATAAKMVSTLPGKVTTLRLHGDCGQATWNASALEQENRELTDSATNKQIARGP